MEASKCRPLISNVNILGLRASHYFDFFDQFRGCVSPDNEVGSPRVALSRKLPISLSDDEDKQVRRKNVEDAIGLDNHIPFVICRIKRLR